MFEQLLQTRNLTPWRHLMNMAGMGMGVQGRIPFGALNVWSSKDDALVAVALPGVEPDQVQLDVEENRLTIRANRTVPASVEGEQLMRREREGGAIERTVNLPHRVDVERAEASFADGMLRIRLPRVEEEKARRIEIRTGAQSGN